MGSLVCGEQRGLGRRSKLRNSMSQSWKASSVLAHWVEGSGRWRCFMREEAGKLSRGDLWKDGAV